MCPVILHPDKKFRCVHVLKSEVWFLYEIFQIEWIFRISIDQLFDVDYAYNVVDPFAVDRIPRVLLCFY